MGMELWEDSEETLGGVWSNLPLRAGSALQSHQVAQGLVQLCLWSLQGQRLHKPAWLASWGKCFSMYPARASRFNLRVVFHVLPPYTAEQSGSLASVTPTVIHRHWGLLLGLPKTASASGWPSSQPLTAGRVLQPWSSRRAFAELIPVYLLLKGRKLVIGSRCGVTGAEQREIIPSLHPLSTVLDAFGFTTCDCCAWSGAAGTWGKG